MTQGQGQGRRIDGWKSIAGHLGRGRSTAIRWARNRGLPVHALPGGKSRSIYALAHELDAWMRGQGDLPDTPPPIDALAAATPPMHAPPVRTPPIARTPARRPWPPVVAGTALLGIGGLSLTLLANPAPLMTRPRRATSPRATMWRSVPTRGCAMRSRR